MSSAVRILAALLGGLCLAAVICAVLLYLWLDNVRQDISNLFNKAGTAEAATGTADLPRIRFLSGVDFDAGPARLILENSLTGGDALLIEDQALLRKAAMSASIPDLGIGGRAGLMAMIFTGGKITKRVPALRLYQSGHLVAEEYCLPRMCDDPDTRAALAPLIAGATGRVVAHDQSFTDYAAYADAFARAKSAPGRLREGPLSQMTQSVHPVHFTITLPSFEQIGDGTTSPELLKDSDDYRDRLRRAIEQRTGGFVDVSSTEIHDPGGINIYPGCDSDPQLMILFGTTIVTPSAQISTDAAGYARAAAIDDWSFLPLRPPPNLPDWLAEMIQTGALAPECPRMLAPDGPPAIGKIAVSPAVLDQYRLRWEEVLPLEADDEPAVLE